MRKNVLRLVIAAVLAWPCLVARAQPTVGAQDAKDGTVAGASGTVVPTRQLVRPAGQSVFFHGRPVDLLIAADGLTAFVKSNDSLLVIDVPSWTVRQEVAYPPGLGASMHGMALTPNGRFLYVTCAQSALVEFAINPQGNVTHSRTIKLPAADRAVPTTRPVGRDSYPCGLALSPDGATAYVCLSTSNALALVDLKTEKMLARIPVGVAPYDVELASNGNTAYVSNWGGRRPAEKDRTSNSAGTPVVIDDRGIASTGTVSVLDLAERKGVAQIVVGLHPAQMVISRGADRLYVANANSDTVSVIDISSRAAPRIVQTIDCRPDAGLPFGSASNALALSDDGRMLYVANGGNNAIAVISLDGEVSPAAPAGFVPAGWYPGAVAFRAGVLFVANAKGVGSRYPSSVGRWNSRDFWGSVGKVAVPDKDGLDRYPHQVRTHAMGPQAPTARRRRPGGGRGAEPVPVPQNVGEPSLFEHVVYIIKENRTYDQVLGDIGKGNSDPSLCIFGRDITPNHHALAEQFVLLDNFYCNGVVSADGHRWVTEGITSDYLEKSFGAWTRSYPSAGNDALAYASSGFIWDHVLLQGLSFRNYGEMVNCRPTPSGFAEIWQDYQKKTGKLKFANRLGLAALDAYTCDAYPGWSLAIPDQVRADVFVKELDTAAAKGSLPHLVMIHLPNDHTNFTSPDYPTPQAMVADNDLALGRIIEAISRSPFWPKTCIFVIEDDPQSGFDHVDGHRSLCFVVSPYTKRGAIISDFYNQTSVLHTMELILGLPPMNQMDALAPVMQSCFAPKADLAPYKAEANRQALDEMNPTLSALSGDPERLRLAQQSMEQPTDEPDQGDDDIRNRVLWAAMRDNGAPYPAAYAGAHGKGLPALKLRLDRGAAAGRESDDD